jgi:hypothetical protein
MAETISRIDDEVVIQVKIKLTGSMLEMENLIQVGVNGVGCIATKEALSQLEVSGRPIKVGTTKLTSKGTALKEYQTPYGMVASLSARELAEDLSQNHGREVTRYFIQKTADMMGSIAQASEEVWEYTIPEQDTPVANISISLDRTCILMKDDGYREAMTGNLSLYASDGARLHTIYIGASPEYGKQKFVDRLQNEINQIKLKYPRANYVGIADGASFNRRFLAPNTSTQILDFYHATEYLATASYSFTDIEKERRVWLSNACHRLKHDSGAAKQLLTEMQQQSKINLKKQKISNLVKEQLTKAITYFTHQLSRMDYAEYVANGYPI